MEAQPDFEDEIDEYGPDPGTFYYIGASPITTARSWAIFPAASQQERKIMQLPKRYTEGSCTVAIVMMKAFRCENFLFYRLRQSSGLKAKAD